ncbi:MAG: ATP-binding protein, partial [candidate division Zixibacteria bacterium]
DNACKLLSYSRPELVRKSILEIVPGLSEFTWQRHWEMIKEEKSRYFEATLYTSQNHHVRARIAAHYMAFEGKEYNCFLVQDLSDHSEDGDETKNDIESEVAERTASLVEEIAGREKIESMLLDEAEKIRNILDNAGQGFLTFGPDLLIDLECSEECRLLFNGEIWGKHFAELIYPDDPGQCEFLTSLLNDVFGESDREKRQVYFSLLPSEVTLDKGRHVEVAYRDIAGGREFGRKLMAILTDVTETKWLRKQVEEKQKRLKMVVRAVVQYQELSEAIRDYEYFCAVQIDQIIKGAATVEEKLYTIFRQVHTFKGTFSQLEMIHVVKKLDRLETQLSRLLQVEESVDSKGLEQLLLKSDLERWLERDISFLKDTLGSTFFNREQTLQVEAAQITDIENRMLSILSPGELAQLLPALRRLKYRSLKELLRTYPEYVVRLSERLQKLLKPMTIQGGDFEVNPDQYRSFCQSLVHVFRNAVDHGIEADEVRAERGKNAHGQIDLSIELENDLIQIDISDDGGGIDLAKVRQKAIARGEHDRETIENMTEDEQVQLIFDNEISTSDTVTQYSGRGMGLSAVREELEKLGGQVDVRSIDGKGTRWRFAIPLIDSTDVPKASTEQIMDSMIQGAVNFMTDEMNLPVEKNDASVKRRVDSLDLQGIVALIGMKGAVSAVIAFCFEDKLARYLTRQFAVGELTEEEMHEYISDTMAEIANIVLGGTLNVLPNISGMITLGTPITCATEASTSLKFAGPEMWTAPFNTGQGRFSLNLRMSEI